MLNKKLKVNFIYSLTILFSSISMAQEASFKEQVDFLKSKIPDITVLSSGNSSIAISPSYQGRIFTSSTNGLESTGIGWFNEAVLNSGEGNQKMAYLGGESRLWFAPEYGEFSLHHKPETPITAKTTTRPEALHTSLFTLQKQSENKVIVEGNLHLENYIKTKFDVSIQRTLSIFSKDEIEKQLDINFPETINYVGFEAHNLMTNKGKTWSKQKGLISIWELGCSLTAKDAKIIIPFNKCETPLNVYFGTNSPDRIKVKNNVIYYKVDAQLIHKIGVPPQCSKNLMASYTPSKNLLSIVTFSLEPGEDYMNSILDNTTPYKGDVINIFNGGPVPEENLELPFYEFESSSLAKSLKKKEQQSHWQRTYHFNGTFEELNTISQDVLGVDLNEVPEF